MSKPEGSLLVLLGNQLFEPGLIPGSQADPVFMAEDAGLCTHFRYHQQKLVLFLAAMRHHARSLETLGRRVLYHRLDDPKEGNLPYLDRLELRLRELGLKRVRTFEVEDKFFEKALTRFCAHHGFELEFIPSPLFLTSRVEFASYLASTRKPFMKTFYERQRKRLGILVDPDGNPEGDQWSFDTENRKPLPKDVQPPPLPRLEPDALTREVITLIESRFPGHPGKAADFWFPVTRKDALAWLDDFIEKRLELFGDYEDALSQRSDFVYHSVLTPILNLGLITPAEITQRALAAARKRKVPMNSLEGFIRQVIGWREFVRGIYQNFSERQDTTNFFNHTRRLAPCWYEGTTGLPPLDHAIRKAQRTGYNHHIERLMVISSAMLLCQVGPREVHRWFMEMYVDSSDWVMGPNVYGMGQFSDGGIFATKPYICGSNYWLKMGDFKKGPWQDGIDGLYWTFVDRNRAFFLKNPRMATMVRLYDKMTADKRQKLANAANSLLEKLTLPDPGTIS